MVIKLNSTSGGASSIGYGLTKKRDIKQADNILAKQNENVLFIRADHLKVNSVLDTPMPSDIYRQMQLRQQVAGMKRKDRFFNIKMADGTTTGISTAIGSDSYTAVYNMKGQRIGTKSQLQQLPRGVYVVGGAKVMR